MQGVGQCSCMLKEQLKETVVQRHALHRDTASVICRSRTARLGPSNIRTTSTGGALFFP